MISYWGVNHGEDVSKALPKPPKVGFPAGSYASPEYAHNSRLSKKVGVMTNREKKGLPTSPVKRLNPAWPKRDATGNPVVRTGFRSP